MHPMQVYFIPRYLIVLLLLDSFCNELSRLIVNLILDIKNASIVVGFRVVRLQLYCPLVVLKALLELIKVPQRIRLIIYIAYSKVTFFLKTSA
jgi:hypothetical protein